MRFCFGENRKIKMAPKDSFSMKNYHFAFDHHGGHKVGPIAFILGTNIAKYMDMPYGKRSVEIGNSKWPPRGMIWQSFDW